jgi:hypothetical protein
MGAQEQANGFSMHNYQGGESVFSQELRLGRALKEMDRRTPFLL